MTQPDELKRDEPLLWSPGTGTQVWQMFRAAMAGDVAAIRRLLAANPALVRCQHAYRTPIYFAVRENQVAAAAYLLEQGADPLSLAVNDTLLEIAHDRGYLEMEQLLHTRFARDQNASAGGEALAGALRTWDLAKVRALLDATPGLLHAGDARSNQPIHWAVMTRQLEAIDELLARGADINARRFDGARPIQLANGDYHYRGWRDVPKDVTTTPADVIRHLRARGAEVDLCTAAHLGDLERVRHWLAQDPARANRVSEYVTYYLGSGAPLKNAAAQGHLEIVKLLLAHGADPNLPEEGIAPRGHALYSAVANGHFEVAQLLLQAGADPSAPVESSADCLSRALNNNDAKMIELLCAYGSARSVELLAHYGDLPTAAAVFAANPKLADDPGALATAAGNGHTGFVRLLLRYQPNLAQRMGAAGKTPELTEFLFDRGMNPNHSDWLGGVPLHEFARRGDLANTALFLDHGANIHARDEDICSTPLGWAAKFGQRATVELLLRRGAKPNLPDDPPWATPLAWAARRGHTEIVAVLKQHGARPLPNLS